MGAFDVGKRCPSAWRSALWCLAALLALAMPLGAQTTGTITGEVVDGTTGRPLAGAQVAVVNTDLGTLTNAEGGFLIPGVPAGSHTIEVTYIGYRGDTQSIEVSAGQTATVLFELGVSAVALDQVVVTGTAGAIERSRLGNSMGVVNVDEVQEVVPVQSFGQVLQARIPGVRAIGTVGGVGAARDLRIRGTTSFELGARPVVYIDGVRVDTQASEWGAMAGATCCSFSGGAGEDRLSDLNPEDIERIEVLKGAAAATLYGSEASAGVIQIFTKTGRSNQPARFGFSTSVGIRRLRENLATKTYPRFTGPDGFRAWDANEHMIQNGLVNTYDMTVAGGGEDVTYFVSGGYGYTEGSIQPNWQKRGNLRVNLRWLASDAWTFEVNSAYARNRILSLQSGNNWLALYGNAVLGNPRNATAEQPYGEPWVPVANIRQVDTFSDASRWTGGLTLNFRASEAFTHRLTVGLDAVSDQKARLLPFGYYYTYLNEIGEKALGYRTFRSFTADYLGQLSYDISSGVQSQLSFGAQGFWETDNRNMATGQGYAGEGVTTVGGAANTFGDEFFQEAINLGLFAQNRFAIADKLFFTAGLRVDGNSAYGVNYGLQPFPKADVAYLISEEGILPEFVSSLKLRAAAGMAGRAPGAYDQFRTFEPTPVLSDVPGVSPAEPGNPELEPEKTTEIEAGFDAGFFDDRIGVNFTAYRAHTRDALLEIVLPPSVGFQQEQLRNAGEVLNLGWELGINATLLESSSLRWSTTLNLDGNSNEILDLGPTAEDGQLGNSLREGYPVNSIFDNVIVDYDAETNTHTRSDTTVYIGQELPTFNASLANTLTLGPFRFYGLISGSEGAMFSNGDRSYRIRQGAGDELLSTFDENLELTAQTDSLLDYYTLVDAYDSRDNIRIREVSASYTLPDGLLTPLGLGRTTLTLAGQNLYWWDDCNCGDPDMKYVPGSSTGFSGFLAMPQPRQFLFSMRTSF